MIYLIIGGSCCGKTSFVKNTWLKGKVFEIKKYILTYVETENAIILGKYSNINERERSGTDTISRSQVSLIGEQVKRLTTLGKDIVLEGDKATSRKLFDYLLLLGEMRLFLLYTDIDTSINRHRVGNTPVKDRTLKAMLSRAKNIFMEYKDIMQGVAIDTSCFTPEDFVTFNIWNIEEYLDKKDYSKTLF